MRATAPRRCAGRTVFVHGLCGPAYCAIRANDSLDAVCLARVDGVDWLTQLIDDRVLCGELDVDGLVGRSRQWGEGCVRQQHCLGGRCALESHCARRQADASGQDEARERRGRVAVVPTGRQQLARDGLRRDRTGVSPFLWER